MNISTEAGYGRYARLLKIAAAIWLLTVSILAVINTVGLSRPDLQRQNTVLYARLQTLAERVEDVEHQFRVFETRPATVSQTDFIEVGQTQKKQIADIEQVLADTVKGGELKAINNRFDKLQERVNALAKPPPTSPGPRKATSPNRRTATPPFRIVDVELRGGERFLSLLPRADAGADDIRLLRPGEAEGGWRLQSLDTDTAVFRVKGQTQWVKLPRE